jgi:hypothetical protein
VGCLYDTHLPDAQEFDQGKSAPIPVMVQLEAKCLGFDKFLAAAANAPEAIRRATARTLNATLTKSQSLMAKRASASYRVTRRDIRANFRTHNANANDLNGPESQKQVSALQIRNQQAPATWSIPPALEIHEPQFQSKKRKASRRR